MVNFEKPRQLNPEIPRPAPEQEERILSLEKAITSSLSSAEKRHIALKVSERLKILGQRDFDELLSIDFREQTLDNPPLQGVFSPESELARIKKLPKEQRREALADFKENLVRQREAWAACRVFIERCIEFAHDVPRKKLDAWVQKFGEQYGFTEQQKKTAERIIDGYYASRQRVLEIRRRCPDNKALVSKLSGIKFDGLAEFDVSTGPMSVDVITDGFNAGRIFQNSKDVVVKLPYAGFASVSRKDGKTFFIVINKDNFRQGVKMRKSTLIHEYEHHKNRLFRGIFDRQDDFQKRESIYFRHRLEQDPEVKRGLLETYFRLHRQKAFQDAKDEVLAMKKDGGNYSYMFFLDKDGSPYDYLARLRDWPEKKDDALYQETAKKVLVDEYRRIFERSLTALHKLEDAGGYSRDEVIAMLADKPFEEWPKTAKRLLEHKGRKPHV